MDVVLDDGMEDAAEKIEFALGVKDKIETGLQWDDRFVAAAVGNLDRVAIAEELEGIYTSLTKVTSLGNLSFTASNFYRAVHDSSEIQELGSPRELW